MRNGTIGLPLLTALSASLATLGELFEFEEKTMPTKLAPKKDFYDSLYDSIRKDKPLFVTPESVRQLMWVMQQARKGTAFA